MVFSMCYRAAAKARVQKQQKEKAQMRQGQLWLAGVITAMVGYILFTGQYITFGYEDDEDEDLEVEDD